MAKALGTFAELFNTPCYRRSPLAFAQNLYAKWLFRRSRIDSPLDFLGRIGIDANSALTGFDRWNHCLQAALKRISDKGDGQGGISLKDGMILFALVRATQPDYVVETGVAAGISTSFLGAALLENGHGHLYSIELPASHDERLWLADGSRYSWQKYGAGWAIPKEISRSLRGKHSLVLSDVCKALPRILSQVPHVDFFFHDDLHTPQHMLWEYELVWPHLRPGGILLSDDANYGWIEFCRRRRLPDYLQNVDRLCAVRKPSAAPLLPSHAKQANSIVPHDDVVTEATI